MPDPTATPRHRAFAHRGAGSALGITRVFLAARRFLRQCVEGVLIRALSDPRYLRVMRWFFEVLRVIRPTARIGSLIVPTGYHAVIEPLRRIQDFNIAEEMTPRMPAGETVLCIDWVGRHSAERTAMEEAINATSKDNFAALRSLIRKQYAHIIGTPRPGDRVEVATGLTEEIALTVATDYFGIGASLDRSLYRRYLRVLARQIFTAPIPGTEVAALTAEASDALITAGNLAVERAASQAEAITVLDHLLQQSRQPGAPQWLTTEWARNAAISLAVFGTATTARAMTQALLQITTHPGGVDSAMAAAALCPNGLLPDPICRQALQQVAFEGLRFNPMLPLLAVRKAMRPTVIGAGTPTATQVRRGDAVFAAPLAAMFDPAMFEQPHKFCPHRDVGTYLHFGAGPHLCVGKEPAIVQFEEVLIALFNNGSWRPERHRILYDGPAVDEFWLLRDA